MRTHRNREGNITHWGLGVAWGKWMDNIRRTPNVDDGLMGAANHYGMCILCNKSVCYAHVSQNLKYNLKTHTHTQ